MLRAMARHTPLLTHQRAVHGGAARVLLRRGGAWARGRGGVDGRICARNLRGAVICGAHCTILVAPHHHTHSDPDSSSEHPILRSGYKKRAP